jgi:hypothetical protein
MFSSYKRFLLLLIYALHSPAWGQNNNTPPSDTSPRTSLAKKPFQLDTACNRCFCGTPSWSKGDLFTGEANAKTTRTLDRDLKANIFRKASRVRGVWLLFAHEGDSTAVLVTEYHFDKARHIKRFNKEVQKRSDGVIRMPIVPMSFSWFVRGNSILIYLFTSNRQPYFKILDHCTVQALHPDSYGPQ